MKRITRAAAALVLTAAAGPALALNICVEGAYPPFSETSPDGSLVGFDIDIANALCAEMGVSCEMMKTDWDGIIPALLEKKCDAIVASMSITPERMEVIDFTKKYYQTPASLAAAEDADFEGTAEGLAGKMIGVQRGTIHETYANQYFPDAEIRGYGSQDEAVLDLIAGRLDAVMADTVVLSEGFLKTEQGAGFDFLGDTHYDPAIHGEGAGIGVRKEDSELRDNLTDAIEAIRADGTYEEISARYFDFDIYGE